jgi:hypothetical protein
MKRKNRLLKNGSGTNFYEPRRSPRTRKMPRHMVLMERSMSWWNKRNGTWDRETGKSRLSPEILVGKDYNGGS